MSADRNLADPDYEPTDEEWKGLCQRAFAGVAERHERAMEKLRAEIEVLRAEVLRKYPPPGRP